MIEAHHGFRKARFAADSYGGGGPAGIPCPRCGHPVIVEYECRFRRPPSVMTAVCYGCGVWYDLGDSELTRTLDVESEAVRRCGEMLRRKTAQTTLEEWA